MRGFTPKGISQALRDRRQPDPPPAPPPPPPPPVRSGVQVHVSLGQVLGAAGWAWGAYSQHKTTLAKEEERILQLAKENFGWLTEVQVMEALEFSARKTVRCLERLVEAGLCQPMEGRLGLTIYVFPQFLPLMVCCGYCDSEVMVEIYKRCPNCGAPTVAP